MTSTTTLAGPAPDGAADPATTTEPPLRQAVLAGAFFGRSNAATAERLAAFLADPAEAMAALQTWFGPDQTLRLSARPGALRAMLDRDIAHLDALIGEQLDAVLHAPRMRRLEGRWRGLHWLVTHAELGRRIKLRVLPVTWAEICRDLERAAEFDQTILFRRLYEDEFGTPGGEPLGLLVVDHEVRHKPSPEAPTDDVSAIARLSAIAAAAFIPTVLSAHPALLEVDTFADLAPVQDVSAPLRGGDHARWRDLRGRADMRFLAVTLPRLLARPRWADDPARRDGFRYRECTGGVDDHVWMSAGYAFALCVIRAFADHGWPADVRGAETDRLGGGVVPGLPDDQFQSGPPEAWTRTAIELQLTDQQERALVEAGLMPTAALPYGAEMVFGATRSLQIPAQHLGRTAAVADANARLSAHLNSMLCVSRFAHQLKVMGREMVGSFQTSDAIQRKLDAWLQGYVNTNTSGGADTRARFPLLGGDVQVREHPGRPGVFQCVAQLQPHHQLDGVSTAFSLVTELAAGPKP